MNALPRRRPHHFAVASIAALVAPIAAQHADPSTPGPGTPTTAVDARDAAAIVQAAAPRLLQLTRDGIEQKEPSANIWRRSGQSPLFDGSYDWHSCIAAHWTVLGMSRLGGDPRAAEPLLARLTPDALAAELNLMEEPAEPATGADAGAGRPRVGTMQQMFRPYADAWFLLLFDEILRHPGRDTPAMRALRRRAEDRLLAVLEQKPFPETPPSDKVPDGAFAGSYRSWLFGYLALVLCAPTDAAAAERRATLTRTRLDPVRARLAAGPPRHRRDFLDVGAIYALIRTLETGAPPPVGAARFTELPTTLPPIADVHVVGACITESWPFAAAPADAAARALFHARTAAFLAREDLWTADFKVATHWLPQFVWFGIWLGTERPGARTGSPLDEATRQR